MSDVTFLAHRAYLAEIERSARPFRSASAWRGFGIAACALLLALAAGVALT
jgi:hypothetical protein